MTVEGVSIGGTLYERSLHYSCSAFCNNAGTSDLTYVLGKDYTKFRAVVGANDAAAEPQDGVFLVGLDGRDLKPVRVAQGHRRTIELDVRGVIRLRLRAYRPGTTRNPALVAPMPSQRLQQAARPGVGRPEGQPVAISPSRSPAAADPANAAGPVRAAGRRPGGGGRRGRGRRARGRRG